MSPFQSLAELLLVWPVYCSASFGVFSSPQSGVPQRDFRPSRYRLIGIVFHRLDSAQFFRRQAFKCNKCFQCLSADEWVRVIQCSHDGRLGGGITRGDSTQSVDRSLASTEVRVIVRNPT
jgi:hypothetical protein